MEWEKWIYPDEMRGQKQIQLLYGFASNQTNSRYRDGNRVSKLGVRLDRREEYILYLSL